MICSKCQLRPATVQFTIIVNGKKTELCLCEQCAKDNDNLSLPDEEGIALQTMLAGLLNGELFKKCMTPMGESITNDVECPVCGMMLSDFIKGGRFGCDECYYAFADKLADVFQRMHGKSSFIGKVPSRAKARAVKLRHIDELRLALADCVKDERYEDAVKLRDEIRLLEQSQLQGQEQADRRSETDLGGNHGG